MSVGFNFQLGENLRNVAGLDALLVEVDALKRLQAVPVAEPDALLSVHSQSSKENCN